MPSLLQLSKANIRKRLTKTEFSPIQLFANNEQGVWYDPSDLTAEKVAWRRNLLTYSENFENSVWTKGGSSILSNFALYSQDFDNAAWFKIGVTINSNAMTAPDSTTTADKLIEDSSTGIHVVLPTPFFTINVGATYTGTVYAKAAERTSIQLRDNSQPSCGATFDLSTGIVVQTEVGVTSAGIESVGNGWYRCRITYVASVATANLQIRLVSSGTTTSYTGDGTSGAFIWGMQLVPGTITQTYTRSLATAAPILFTNPFGDTVAQKVVENTASIQHYISNAGPTLVAGVPYTYTLYEKADERSRFQIFGYLAPGTFAYFVNVNLTTKTLSSPFNCTASLLELPNGWFRTNVTFTPTITGQAYSQLYLFSGSTSTDTNYTGSGTSGLYIYGAQVEQRTTASAYQKITDFNTEFLSAFPTHTLYQDATVGALSGSRAGVTPVTNFGQSVGFVLDKRLGTPGPNLFPNPSWTTLGGWEVVNNCTTSLSNGQLIIHATGISPAVGYQLTTVIGQQYQFRVRLVQDAMTGNTFIGVGSGGAVGWTANIINENLGSTTGLYSVVFTATSTNTRITLFGSTAALAGEILVWSEPLVRTLSGNHAIQSTIGSRPTLQARTNLVIGSETLSTFTVLSSPSISANSTVAPDGTITADRFEVSAGQTGFDIRNVGPDSSAGNNAYSVYFKRDAGATGTLAIGRPDRRTTTVNIATLAVTNQTIASEIPTMGRVVDVGNGWYRLECGVTLSTSTEIRITVRDTVPGSAIWLWGAQSELGTSPTTYQRVTTTTDYTDVGTSRALQFDGVDDWMWTSASINFSTTDKMTVFSGLTKLNDTATGIVSELSINVGSNNGTFVLAAPSTNGANSYRYTSRGTVESFAGSGVFASAPDTTVLTSVSDIGADIVQLRRNTAVVETSNTDQGTGNYGTYPLYIGRRGESSFPFNGRIHQLLIRGAATDDFTITNTERWVARRTGVNL